MSTIKEIKSAITRLKPLDVDAVADWVQIYRDELWDKQIEANARAAKLHKLPDTSTPAK